MPKGHKRSQSQISKDTRLISSLYLRGYTQHEISERINLSQPVISRTLKSLQEQWRNSDLIDINEAKQKELAKIDHLELEYYEAWERSCQNTESNTSKVVKTAGGKGKPGTDRQEATQSVKTHLGDPRYLQGVERCIDKRCKILGLDAPIKLDQSIASTTDHKLEILSTPELETLLKILEKMEQSLNETPSQE
jgi:predicted transcriptional regulator